MSEYFQVVAHSQGAGLQTPELLPFPDLTQPEKAFPLYPQPAIDSTLVTSVSDVYLQNLDMPELIEKARTAVIRHAMAILKADPDREVDYIVLDFPCTFFMLRALRYCSSSSASSCPFRALFSCCQSKLVDKHAWASCLRLFEPAFCTQIDPQACLDMTGRIVESYVESEAIQSFWQHEQPASSSKLAHVLLWSAKACPAGFEISISCFTAQHCAYDAMGNDKHAAQPLCC